MLTWRIQKEKRIQRIQRRRENGCKDQTTTRGSKTWVPHSQLFYQHHVSSTTAAAIVSLWPTPYLEVWPIDHSSIGEGIHVGHLRDGVELAVPEHRMKVRERVEKTHPHVGRLVSHTRSYCGKKKQTFFTFRLLLLRTRLLRHLRLDFEGTGEGARRNHEGASPRRMLWIANWR